MSAYRSRPSPVGLFPLKPSQKRTIALPFDEPQDAIVLPYTSIPSVRIHTPAEGAKNALGLSGLRELTMGAPDDANEVDVAALASGMASMMSATSAGQAATQVQSHQWLGPGSAAIQIPNTHHQHRSTGSGLFGHLLAAVSPPLSPTHGGPFASVNFG